MAVVIPIRIFRLINDMRQLKWVPKNAPVSAERKVCVFNETIFFSTKWSRLGII